MDLSWAYKPQHGSFACCLKSTKLRKTSQLWVSGHGAQISQVSYNFDALSVPEQQRQRTISSLAKQLGVAEKLQVGLVQKPRLYQHCLEPVYIYII